MTHVTLPPFLRFIQKSAFGDCKRLTEISIPNSVTSISYGAFSNCESLTSIKLPDGLISLGDEAFSYCVSLTTVTIPSSITCIGKNTFIGCDNLKNIEIDTKNAQEFKRISDLVPQAFRHLVNIRYFIIKTQEQVIKSFKGLDFFPVKLPESVIDFILKYDEHLNDAINQVPLPEDIVHIEGYEQLLIDRLNQFKQEHEHVYHRHAAIHKLQNLIRITEEALKNAEIRVPHFFNSSNTQSNIESRARVAVAKKLIGWLSDDKTTIFTLKEKALIAKPQGSMELILKNHKINLDELTTSSLSLNQIGEIDKLIKTLESEINSFWPYPNKNRKHEKVKGLKKLIEYAKTMEVSDAVNVVETEYPSLREGRISTRTADLLDELNKPNFQNLKP